MTRILRFGFVWVLLAGMLVSLSAHALFAEEMAGKGAAAFERGTKAVYLKNWDEAATAFREAVRLEPNSGSYRYSLVFALKKTGRLEEAWEQLRVAVRLAPENKAIVREFSQLWQIFDRKGIFNVGVRQSEVQRLLGKPDSVVGSRRRPRWIYGFKSINFADGRVYSLMDMRNVSKAAGNPLARMQLPAEQMKEWKIGYRSIAGASSTSEYVTGDDTVQNWQVMLTNQRFTSASQRMTAHELAEEIRDLLKQGSPEAEFKMLREYPKDTMYEWKVPAKDGRPAGYEIVRLLQGSRDIHRIAFAAKTESIPRDKRFLWMGILTSAKLVPTNNAN